MKIVINSCYGGFSISKECALYMENLGCKIAKAELDSWRKDEKAIKTFLKKGKFPKNTKGVSFLEIDVKYKKEATFHGYGYTKHNGGYSRTDKFLVEAVEKLGKKASGRCANLKVIEIPDNIEWEISEYDGYEHIAEKHETWN